MEKEGVCVRFDRIKERRIYKVEPIQQFQPDSSGDPSKNRQATAALVLGILGLIASVIIAIAGVILGIVGIVLANNGKKSEKKTQASAGMILSVLAIILGVINGILGALFFAMFST
jgi:uncharacterized membrane protein